MDLEKELIKVPEYGPGVTILLTTIFKMKIGNMKNCFILLLLIKCYFLKRIVFEHSF